MSFDLDKFTAEPSVELLNLGKKTDLLNLAKHYKLSEIKSSMRKHEIKNILVQYFVDEEIFNENALSLIVDVQSVSSSKELELKFQIRQLEIQEREKEREREREREREERKEREKEREREREEREKEREREREEREKEREREREEREREEREKEREREREREEREKEREFQLRMREIEMQERANQLKQMIEYNFDITKHIRLVPPFQEKEVDKYFLHFEKVAENLNWPKEHWTLLLQSVLIGKAREIHTQLGVEQSHHYETVKELILKGYELVPEAYRQKFRNCKKDSNQTHVEFARNKEQLFDRWCCSKKIDQNYDQLRQLVLVEEFKRCIQSDVKTFLDEKQVETLEEAARLADDYYLTHKVSFIAKPKPTSSHPQNKFMSGNSSGMPSQSNTPKHNSTSETKSQYPLSRPTCNYCKKPGHLVSECLKLKGEAKLTGLTTLSPRPQSSNKTNTTDIVTKPKSDSTMEIFEPFMLNGFVSLSGDNCPPTPIKILRDTGASQSLILADILPFSEKTSSGTSVLIQGVECGTVNIPLHHVNLSSDLVTGPVVIGIKPSLPFKGVHLLLGNDLAGDKVVVNPLVTDTPNIGQTDDPIEQEIPDLYPSCAVTRAMAKKAILKNSNSDIDLTDTFIGQYFNNEIKKSLDPSLSDIQTDSSMSCHSPPRSIDQGHDTLSKSQLIQEQQTDPEISKLIFRALPEDEISQVPICYYIKNGLFMRKWRPFDVPADDEWAVNHQIVVPKSYRHEILSIAHESPMSGHLGINKTYHKIINHFYWPGLKSDVSKYCKTCHTCQMVGKLNQTIPKAQLQPISAFDEPFSRILIDCVGPLPRTKSGNEYLLTIMCTSTRFPEAIPLRNIKTKSIVKALIKFFTLVGLPKSVQSDQGSNFMSGIFQQVMHELGIKQYRSSAYHPESQGALERFHQTLKNMIRSYCFDAEKDWDEGIHLLLFAVRESVQESLGFSPFELVFGHSVRGPLKLLKEKFLSNDETPLNLLQYVSDFRNRLFRACEVARSNLKTS